MSIEIQAGKSSRVRAIADARPDLTEDDIARRLGIKRIEVHRALTIRPTRRIKSIAK